MPILYTKDNGRYFYIKDKHLNETTDPLEAKYFPWDKARELQAKAMLNVALYPDGSDGPIFFEEDEMDDLVENL